MANISNIVETNQTVVFEPDQRCASIANLMPDVRSKYYYYEGSLEAPPCPETIKWIVFDEPMELTSIQMSMFRGVLKTSHGTPQVKSWRFTQERNGRKIFVSPGIGTSMTNGQAYSFDELIDISFGG